MKFIRNYLIIPFFFTLSLNANPLLLLLTQLAGGTAGVAASGAKVATAAKVLATAKTIATSSVAAAKALAVTPGAKEYVATKAAPVVVPAAKTAMTKVIALASSVTLTAAFTAKEWLSRLSSQGLHPEVLPLTVETLPQLPRHPSAIIEPLFPGLVREPAYLPAAHTQITPGTITLPGAPQPALPLLPSAIPIDTIKKISLALWITNVITRVPVIQKITQKIAQAILPGMVQRILKKLQPKDERIIFRDQMWAIWEAEQAAAMEEALFNQQSTPQQPPKQDGTKPQQNKQPSQDPKKNDPKPAAAAGAAAAEAVEENIDKIKETVTQAAQQASRITTEALEKGIELTLKDTNKFTHVFDNLDHLFKPVLDTFNGDRNELIRAVMRAAQDKLPLYGKFKNISVQLGEFEIYIRGIVINGVPRLGTMFIPKDL